MAACKKTLRYQNPNPKQTYSFVCPACGWSGPLHVDVEARDEQVCGCGAMLDRPFPPSGIQLVCPRKFMELSRVSEADRDRKRGPRYHRVVKA